jgi:hypothetical protein
LQVFKAVGWLQIIVHELEALPSPYRQQLLSLHDQRVEQAATDACVDTVHRLHSLQDTPFYSVSRAGLRASFVQYHSTAFEHLYVHLYV